MNVLSKICGVVLIVVAFCDLTHASELEMALSKLENWKREYTRADLAQWTDTIRSQGTKGDPIVGKRLVRVVANEGVPISVRRESLELACEKADPTTASQIVATFTAWCLEVGRDQPRKHLSEPRGVLISIGITEYLSYLEQAVRDQQPILRLLALLANTPPLLMVEAGCVGIAESPAPLELRRAAALEVIEELRGATACPEPLLRVLGPEAFPALRKLFRQSQGPENFHYHAASALAHLGAEEILGELQAWVPRLAEKHHHLAQHAKGYIWQINAQHPPSRLLEYVESKGSTWAMQRALELGIPKADIRDAALAYVARLRASGTQRDYSEMVVMKHSGLELGILEPDDMPDVKVPKYEVDP